MREFSPGELVWWWSISANRATHGIVLEVQEADGVPTPQSPHQYVVLTDGQRRLLSPSRLKRSREDCKWLAMTSEDIVAAQPMTAPVSDGLFEWTRKREGDE